MTATPSQQRVQPVIQRRYAGKARHYFKWTHTHEHACGAGLAALSALTELQGLDVSHSSITSQGFSHLSHLPSLRDLAIAGTNVTVPSELAEVLRQHSQLTRLDISLCG